MKVSKDYIKKLDKLLDDIFDRAQGWTDMELSDRAKLSYATVNKIANRRTRLPQLRTIYQLAAAVGMELVLIGIMKEQRKVG